MKRIVLLLVVVVAGASAMLLRTSRPAAPAVLTVTARDYAFEAPDSVAAGMTTIHLVNQGPEFHHVQLLRLDGGHTVAEYLEALRTGAPPAWATDLGGPNTPMPGGTSDVTVNLEPGNYAIVCHIPSPDGVPHIAKGMMHEFAVTGTAPATVAFEPDVEVTLSDYDFTMSRPLAAGTQRIRVRNAAAQPHEILLIQLAEGKTGADFLQWFATQQGAPPAVPVGGTTAISTGGTNDLTVELAAGDYLLICFIPDAKDGKPHFVHGMVKTITIG